MGASSRKPIIVTIPDELREKAGGVTVVTCRHYGGGQIERVATARSVRMMERTEKTGPVMLASIKEHPGSSQAREQGEGRQSVY